MTSAPVTIPQKFDLSRRPKPPPAADTTATAMNGSLTNGMTTLTNGASKRKRSIDEQAPENDQAPKRIKNPKASILNGEEDLVIVDDGPIVIE